jgi:hypothetical protein
MRQQIFEQALKSIVLIVEGAGPTHTHDHEGDRRRANYALGLVVKIANAALNRNDDPPGMNTTEEKTNGDRT